MQPATLAAELLHTWQQDDAKRGENQIRHPDADRRRDGALASESSAGNEKQVISRDHGHRDQGAGGTATATWLRRDGYGHQRKNQASKRKCQATMELHARFKPAGAVICYKTADGTFRITDLPLFSGHEVVDFDGPVALSKGSDGIAVRTIAIKLVSGTTLKMYLQRAVIGIG